MNAITIHRGTPKTKSVVGSIISSGHCSAADLGCLLLFTLSLWERAGVRVVARIIHESSHRGQSAARTTDSSPAL